MWFIIYTETLSFKAKLINIFSRIYVDISAISKDSHLTDANACYNTLRCSK